MGTSPGIRPTSVFSNCGPALAYASHVWHQPLPNPKRKDCHVSPLSIIQNQCLHSIAGTFRATPIRALANLTFIPPLDIFLTTRSTIFLQKAQDNCSDYLRDEICHRILRVLRPRSRLIQVAKSLAHPQPLDPNWVEAWLQLLAPPKNEAPRKFHQQVIFKRWDERWRASIPIRSGAMSLDGAVRRYPISKSQPTQVTVLPPHAN